MQLYPRDLGARRYVAVLNRRTQASAGQSAGSRHSIGADPFLVTGPSPHRHRRRRVSRTLRRFWVRGLNLDRETEAQTLADLSDTPLVVVATILPLCLMPLLLMPALVLLGIGGATPFLLWMLGAALVAASTAALVPRNLLRQLSRRPVTLAEADALYETATLRRDRLERAYFGLVRDVIACENVPDGAAEHNLRAALRALGEAISRLPAGARDARSPKDAAALSREAALLRARVASEMDPVIAASLGRQADTLEQRAALHTPEQDAAAHRARALRRELEGHIETLRDGLLTFSAGKMDADSLKHLARAVGQVAGDADAVQEARAELDDEELAAVLAAARGTPAPQQTIAAPAPKTQQVSNGTGNGTSSGPWWRNSG